MIGKLLVLLTLFTSIHCAEKEFISLSCREKAGMFSIFQDVLCLVKYYDACFYRGIEVDFETAGIYYDRRHGPNWWNYYCEPILFGKKENVRKVLGDVPFQAPSEINGINRHLAHHLIDKYIHLKPHIVKKIDDFKSKHFENSYVIGVHYRGTDKVTEARPVSYSYMVRSIKNALDASGKKNIKVFIATDESAFLNHMKSIFKSAVICVEGHMRSASKKRPIHLTNNDPYKCGEDAIVDTYLLGECDVLIRTASNLSLWSTFLNPDMPVNLLN